MPKKPKKKSFILNGWIISGLVMVFLGISCVTGQYILKNYTYHAYISISTATDIQIRRDSYMNAIRLIPENTEAFSLLLDTYAEDGVFSKAESESFLSLYNTYHSNWHSNTATGTLHAKIGSLYINGYEDTPVAALRMSYPFFEYAANELSEGDDGYVTAWIYHQIGKYYQNYIWTATATRDVSADQMTAMMSDIEYACQVVFSDDDISSFDQLGFCNTVCNLLIDQRDVLAATCTKEQIDRILDLIYSDLPNVQSLQHESTRESLTSLQDNESTYREMIARAFARTEGGNK